MGFDIMSLQKGRGPVQARSKADEGRAVLKYIDVEDLVPSEDNFYSMSAIDELAGLIELSGGVKQPGLVVPLGGGKYKVISGHRRRLASLQLVKQGKEAYRKMPCMVEDGEREPGPEADELRAIDEAILLITTNGQREKTDWDKVQEATRLRALLDRKRRFEKIPGETRKLIAEQLGTTPAQVGRYDSIEKHLIPAFKGWLEEGKIGISVAYELSTLPEDVQENAAAECWGKRGGRAQVEACGAGAPAGSAGATGNDGHGGRDRASADAGADAGAFGAGKGPPGQRRGCAAGKAGGRRGRAESELDGICRCGKHWEHRGFPRAALSPARGNRARGKRR